MEINSSLQTYNKNNICRICMQDSPNLFPIFKEVFLGNRTTTLAEIITECTKYPVAHNDQLPAQICNDCMDAARNAQQFKRQTEEAYCHLKALYDITWIPKQEKGSGSKSGAAATVRVSALTTDKYTQTEKSTVFQCECCPKKFFVENELRQHRATIHVNDAKKCRVCGEIFNHLGQLKVHLSTEHPSEGIRCDFKCNVCSREFTRKDHLKRHLIRVHKIEDDKLNISKVSLDEPEIENPPQLSASLNNYSSHWPDYQEDDDNEAITTNETMAATNPFSSEDEGHEHHNFNDMDEEDVKQFVETIAHPEISIKVENSDYTYNTTTSNDNNKQEKLTKCGNSSFETLLKPEKSEDKIEIKENAKEEAEQEDDDDEEVEDNLNSSLQDVHSNNTSELDTDEDYQNSSDEEQEDNLEATNKPNKTDLLSTVKQEECTEKTENPSSSKAKLKNKLNASTKPPRRRHGSSKNEDNRCKECNRTFTRYNHLLRHMLTHSDEKPHVCNFCGKGFSRSDHLQKHIQSIHCEKNYKCDQCSSAYGRKDHLQRHIETRHNKDPTIQKPQFDCDMCEKKFTTKAYLAKHKLLHTDRLYACKHCSETFPEKEQMKEHQKKKHAQPRNFLCNICGDSFQRNEYLKIHMRRHTGEKPYKCRFCEKGFPRSTDLKMHERYHIGHKPNLCNLCGKGFHRPYNLTIHMRTHTGEKPYKCNQCPQAFAQSNDLKAHIRRHTGERFRCDMCSAAFLQRYGLNAHLRTVHGIIVTSFTGRLRKTEQPIEGAGEGEQVDQLQTSAPPTQQLAPAQEQSSNSLPSPHLLDSSNVTPPPLYLGHNFINPIPSAIGTTPTSPPIDISSTSATSSSLTPLPLAHTSTQQQM